MSQEATLHIKLDRETDERLKRLASARKTSKGRLAREAILACYQTDLQHLSLHQQRALAACQGGFISVGKFARVMGLHVLDARRWLAERGLEMADAFNAEDPDHA